MLTYFLSVLWYRLTHGQRNRDACPPCSGFNRRGRDSHNMPRHADVSRDDAVLEKNHQLLSQQVVMHTWRWEATQVLPRLQEKWGGFLDFICLFTRPCLYSQVIKMSTMLPFKGKNYVAHYLSTQMAYTVSLERYMFSEKTPSQQSGFAY